MMAEVLEEYSCLQGSRGEGHTPLASVEKFGLFRDGKFPFLYPAHESNSVEFGDQGSGDKIAIHLQLPQEKKKNVRLTVAFHTF